MLALIGGMMIGLAAAMLLLTNGRIMGVSGIVGNLISPSSLKEKKWRIVFLLGLFAGAFLVKEFLPSSLSFSTSLKYWDYALAGLLVGVGTTMGSGCTSGHGVCGISRFSPRSIIATCTFIAFGVLGFFLSKIIHGGF
nr:YeeE/YedE family protein [Bacteriovorax sp. HI3]